MTDGVTAAELTVSEPALIGWLHTLEAISQLCMASARYRAAANYARRVLKAEGYPTRAAGTVLLALARLEDQDGFFALAHQLEEEIGADALENSPWYLLARTILLFKTNKMRPATRALREFANRCEGGAFFLLNPMYQTPYLPCRPEPHDPWIFRTRPFGKRTVLSRTLPTLPLGQCLRRRVAACPGICAPLRFLVTHSTRPCRLR